MRSHTGSTIVIHHTAKETTIEIPDVSLFVIPLIFLTLIMSVLCFTLALRRS